MRTSWDSYFLDLAVAISKRATCPRASVGCVIVREKRILTTGYNGSISGEPHCTDVGCKIEHGHCQRTIHAELNALLQAARVGIRLEGAQCYVTHEPCLGCLKHLKGAGIDDICFGECYVSL